MGGSRRQTQQTSTTQRETSSSQLGSTPFATSLLDDYMAAGQSARDRGVYTGPVAATQEELSQYSPIWDPQGRVTQLIADPGAPLSDYTPDVQIRDRYIAGLGEASREGIQGGRDWISSATPWVTQGATDMGNFWGDVARGVYLDPNQNQAYQDWLGSFDESMRDDQTRNINNFNDAATMAGAYGDTNFARGRTWMADEYDQNRSATVANMAMNLYNTEMARRERASQGLNDAFQLGGSPFAALDLIGERQRQGEQLDLDNEAARASEVERQQAYEIQDAQQRRRDEFLRNQAGLDNEAAMAQWDYNRQGGQIADAMGRAQVRQQNAQAGLVNDQNSWNAQTFGDMDILERMFGGMSNDVFGQNSEGTMTGESTTTTRTSVPAWQSALGALSAIGSTIGALSTGGAAGGIFSQLMGGLGGGKGEGGGVTSPMFQPINIQPLNPQNYMQNYSNYDPYMVPWLRATQGIGGGG